MGKQAQPGGSYQQPQSSTRGPQPFENPGFGGGTAFSSFGDAAEYFGMKAPGTPDYMGAAEKTAVGNRPDINTPFGQQQWTQNPDGSWTMNQGFSGPMGGLGGALGQQAWDSMSGGLDLSSLGGMPDPSKARQEAIDASYGEATKRLDPMWEKREEAARTRLANQGLDPNSEAAKNMMTDVGNARNDAYTSAMNSAVMQGNAAGESFFRQGMMGRQQQLAELLRQRGQPLAEMMAMQGLLNMPNTPGGPDYLGATAAQGNYDLGAWGAESKNKADTIKGLGEFGGELGKLLFMLSDERAKRDIIREDEDVIPGVPLASWEYRHAPGRRFWGVIAQDLEKVAPHMVKRGSDGFLRVNYEALCEAIHG